MTMDKTPVTIERHNALILLRTPRILLRPPFISTSNPMDAVLDTLFKVPEFIDMGKGLNE